MQQEKLLVECKHNLIHFTNNIDYWLYWPLVSFALVHGEDAEKKILVGSSELYTIDPGQYLDRLIT